MNFCKNHPDVPATGKCLTCHLPICDQCRVEVKDVGTFCSKACADKYMQYQKTYEEKRLKMRRVRPPSMFTVLLKFIVVVAIVLGVAWAVSKYVFGYELTDLINRFLP
jgi:hypothetical protein